MPVQQLLQPAQGRHMGYALVLPLFGEFPALEDLIQVLPHRLFDEQGLGVLGQHPHGAGDFQLPPIGLPQAGEQLEAGGLPGAVAPQQSEEFPLPQGQGEALDHIRQVLVILEPQLAPPQHHIAALWKLWFRAQRFDFLPACETGQPLPALPDGDRAGGAVVHGCPDPHGGGHGQEHGMSALP